MGSDVRRLRGLVPVRTLIRGGGERGPPGTTGRRSWSPYKDRSRHRKTEILGTLFDFISLELNDPQVNSSFVLLRTLVSKKIVLQEEVEDGL